MNNIKNLLTIIVTAVGLFVTINCTAQNSVDKDSVATEQNVFTGIASFYADKFHGRKTSIGETFNQQKMTCASNKIKVGSWLRVTNLKNGKIAFVRVNDLLHAKNKRLIDVSYTAAKKLDFIKQGITKVKVEIIKKKKIT